MEETASSSVGRTDKTSCVLLGFLKSCFLSAQGQVKSHKGRTDTSIPLWNITLNWWLKTYFGCNSYLPHNLYYISEILHYDGRYLGFHCTTYLGDKCFLPSSVTQSHCQVFVDERKTTSLWGSKVRLRTEKSPSNTELTLLAWGRGKFPHLGPLSSLSKMVHPSFTKHNWLVTMK